MGDTSFCQGNRSQEQTAGPTNIDSKAENELNGVISRGAGTHARARRFRAYHINLLHDENIAVRFRNWTYPCLSIVTYNPTATERTYPGGMGVGG